MSSSARSLTPLTTIRPTPPMTMRRTTMVRNATRSLVCTLAGARATRPTARLRRLRGFVQEAKEVTPELLWVEAHSEVVYAQSTVRGDRRGEERVIDIAVGRFRYE